MTGIMKSSFLPKHNFVAVGVLPVGVRRQRCQVVAYRESEEMKDWRVKKMVQLCHSYFSKLWSKGEVSAVSEILDENFVHHDHVWRKKKLIVGQEAMAEWVKEMKKCYPDLFVEPVDFGTGSIEHLFVQFEGRGTNLGRWHGKSPTRHHSTFSGVSTFRFNHDRSRITSVDVWRTPFTEDHVGGVDPTDLLEIHLNRLHFE